MYSKRKVHILWSEPTILQLAAGLHAPGLRNNFCVIKCCKWDCCRNHEVVNLPYWILKLKVPP